MLVLSRQREQVIMIGDDIEITIVDILGRTVRVGITAPADVPIHRLEVYTAIKREEKQSGEISRSHRDERSAGDNLS